MDFDVVKKAIIIGDSSVGKTCILCKLVDPDFDFTNEEERPLSTLGLDFKQKYYNVDDTDVKLTVWDTAG